MPTATGRRAALPLLAAPFLPTAARAQPGVLAEVLDRGTLRVGVWLGARPFSFRLPDGSLNGSEVAVARLVAARLGLRVEFVPLDLDERVPALQSGRVDLSYGAFVVVPERARQVLFLNPHARMEFGIVSRADRPLRGPRDLAGLRLGMAGDLLVLRVAGGAIRPEQEVLHYPDNEATHRALLAGEVDALFTSRARASITVSEHPELAWRFSLQQHWMAGVVAFGEHDLLRTLNTALLVLAEQGLLEEISRHYLGYSSGRLPVI